MTDITHVDETKKVSPKVWAGLITGFAIAAIGGIIASVTPDTFAFLGAWGPIIYSLVTIGGAQLAAYLKSDPLRANTVVLPAPVVTVTAPDGPINVTPPLPVDNTFLPEAVPTEPTVTTAEQVAGH